MPLPASSEETIPSGLKLPEGQIVPGDDEDKGEYILFSMEEYRTIVHIYNGYVLYDENREYVSRFSLLDAKLDEIEVERLALCLDTQTDIKTELDDMFDIWTQEHKLRLQEKDSGSVREILVGLGTGVGGLIVGAAVGIIWSNAAK